MLRRGLDGIQNVNQHLTIRIGKGLLFRYFFDEVMLTNNSFPSRADLITIIKENKITQNSEIPYRPDPTGVDMI